MHAVAVRGLAEAAEALAGDDPPAVCATLRRWRERGQRELPWLAGPCLTALQRAGVTLPSDGDLRTVTRFLVGAEDDADAVAAAIDGCVSASAGDIETAVPPDARGALAEAVERFFELLATTYGLLHAAVRDGHRRDADDLIATWQPQLDDAAEDVDERVKVLTGEVQRAVPQRSRPAWGTRDRPGCALAFVAVALLVAAALVWSVLHGWPAEPIPFVG